MFHAQLASAVSTAAPAPGRVRDRLLSRLLSSILAIGSLVTQTGCTLPSPLAPQLGGTVGSPSHGMQTGAVELPVKGPGYARFRDWSPNYWGQPRLVRGVEAATAAVAKGIPGTPRKLIGDLSARHGGKIPHHNSHRTGRDVDLLFYTTTPEGAPVRSPGFVHFGADGLAYDDVNERYVRIDVPREWALIKALLRSPHFAVQWMFISRELEALIIEYAIAKGEDLELLWHAETVLLQPGDSASHDDHIHLRIACEPEEVPRGCDPGGPHWAWLDPLPEGQPFSRSELEALASLPPVLPSRTEAPTGETLASPSP